MPMLVTNCPRCGSQHTTFDVKSGVEAGESHGWQKHYELFCQCRQCFKSVIFQVSHRDYEFAERTSKLSDVMKIEAGINYVFRIDGYINLKDNNKACAPEHLPKNVKDAFDEAATCLAVGCYNASAAMFRLSIDAASKGLLPSESSTAFTGQMPNQRERTVLASRLEWLFKQGILSETLRNLAKCVRDDGNDGAHDGTLAKAEAEDLLDFSTELLERIFTEPERLRMTEERRIQRRSS